MSDLPALIVPTIAVYNATTGELRDLAAAGNVPKGYSSCSLPADYNEVTWRWNVTARAMVEDASRIEAALIKSINDERETRQMAAMTTGGAKKAVYAMQQAEVLAWAGLGAVGATTTQLIAAFNLLPLTTRKQKFYFALMSMAKRGEPNIAAAIGRFSAGAAGSNAEVARVEAIAQDGIAAIKAANTAAAKRAAFAAVSWTWSPA